MADRRMLSKAIMNLDDMVDMSFAAQNLYMRLILAADDEGFLSGARSIMRSCLIPAEALTELIDNGYVIQFPSGVIVICHWHEHNNVPPSKKKPTIYKAEKDQLIMVGSVLRLREDVLGAAEPPEPPAEPVNPPAAEPTAECGKQLADNRQQNGSEVADNQLHKEEQNDSTLCSETAAQVRLGKDRLGQCRLGEGSTGQVNNPSSLSSSYAGAREENSPYQRKGIIPQKGAPFDGKVWLTDEEAKDLRENYDPCELRVNCGMLLANVQLMPAEHYSWLCARTMRREPGT